MDRIRLLKCVNSFATGGTECQFVALAERLDRNAVELHLACLRRWGELLPRAERLSAPLAACPIGNLYGPGAWQQRLRLARYLGRHAIQLVHTYSLYPNLFAIPAARAAGVPVVIASIRDTGADFSRARDLAQTLMCRLADRLLVNADAVRDWLMRRGFPADSIRVIPNGIDLARFPGTRGSGRLHHELGLPPGTPIVAVLSRLSRVKGLEDFVEAAASIARRRPEVRFVLTGEGQRLEGGQAVADPSYRETLAAAARRAGLGGRLVFLGNRADVPEILPDVAVSVLPSLTEGLSNSLLESLAAGRAMVATRVGGTPEVVEDGVTGMLVSPRDPASLARAIERLLDDADLRFRLGAAGRRRVLGRFSMERMVRATEDLYREELDRVGRGLARRRHAYDTSAS
jgi:glycosyltransferase involved in cell wall biosynthesis